MGFLNFMELDAIVNEYIGQYEGEYLNDISPFDKLLPTIENMGEVFYEDLKECLINRNYDLIQLDISENLLRVYSISDRLYLGSKPVS